MHKPLKSLHPPLVIFLLAIVFFWGHFRSRLPPFVLFRSFFLFFFFFSGEGTAIPPCSSRSPPLRLLTLCQLRREAEEARLPELQRKFLQKKRKQEEAERAARAALEAQERIAKLEAEVGIYTR